MMKNDLGFIPDNISAISYASLYGQPTHHHDAQQSQYSSGDHEQVLRHQADRLEEKLMGSFDESHKKLLVEIRDPIEFINPSDVKLKQSSSRTDRLKQSRHEMIPELNESVAEHQEVSETVSPVSQSRNSAKQVDQKGEEKPIQSSEQPNILHFDVHSQGMLKEDEANHGRLLEQAQQHSDESYNKFQLPKVDRSPNESLEQKDETEKAIKLNNSQSPSEKRASSYSQYLNNFIEEDINEESSDPKSSNELPDKKQKIGQANNSSIKLHTSHISHNSHNSHHSHNSHNSQRSLHSKFTQQNLLQQEFNTPNKFIKQQVGYYQFIPKNTDSPEERLVQAITNNLNNIQQSLFQHGYEDKTRQKNQSPKRMLTFSKKVQESFKLDDQSEYETNVSHSHRELKILEHKYESNNAVITNQTRQLIDLCRFEMMRRQHDVTRMELMALEIENNKLRISLRNASYTKKFNFISPIHKNNDQPIEFRSKFNVDTELIRKMDKLKQQIEREQALFEEQENKLSLLTKYYNLMKRKKISNNQDDPIMFQYNSKLGRYSQADENVLSYTDAQPASQNPLATTHEFNQTQGIKTSQSRITPSGQLAAKMASPLKRQKQTNIEPIHQAYNLLRYKSDVAKSMILEYEVYNLGKEKRFKDENRLMKKELEFVDRQIEHFNQVYAEEMRNYEERGKEKINYQAFKLAEKQTAFSKSPYCRDYLGNDKGSNNINIYRPDNKQSKTSFNKSLSQSKYSIRRDDNKSRSRKELPINHEYSGRQLHSTTNLFKRERISQQDNDYYEGAVSFNKIQSNGFMRTPKKSISISKSPKSISVRSKNLLRFNREPQSEQNLRDRSKEKISSKQITSVYLIGSEKGLSK